MAYYDPTFDVNFAYGDNPVSKYGFTFTRATAATYVNAAGNIATAASGELRYTYDPVTLSALGVLIEEQRTNLLLNTDTLSTQSVTVTAVAHTLSFYGTGTVTLSGVSTAGPLVGTGAFPTRVTLTFTPTAGSLTLTVTGSVRYANLEVGSFATSWIPTTGTAATRNADVLSLTGAADVIASWFNKDAGTIVEKVAAQASTAFASATPVVWIDDGSANNRFGVRTQGGTYNGLYTVRSAGVAVADQVITAAFAYGVEKTIAYAYAVNDFRAAVNGSLNVPVTSGALPSGLTTVRIGRDSSAVTFTGTISRIRYYNSRIPDDDLLLLSNGVDLSTPLKGGRARKRLVYIVKQDDDLDSLIESLSQESVRDYL